MNYFTFVKNNWSSLGFPNYKSGVSAQKMKDAYKAAKGTSTPAKPSKKKNKKDDVKTENKTESTATTLKHMDVLLEKMYAQQAALKKMAPIKVPKILPKPIKNGYAFGTPQPVIVPKKKKKKELPKKKEYLPVKYKPSYMSHRYDYLKEHIDKQNQKKADPLYQFAG